MLICLGFFQRGETQIKLQIANLSFHLLLSRCITLIEAAPTQKLIYAEKLFVCKTRQSLLNGFYCSKLSSSRCSLCFCASWRCSKSRREEIIHSYADFCDKCTKKCQLSCKVTQNSLRVHVEGYLLLNALLKTKVTHCLMINSIPHNGTI